MSVTFRRFHESARNVLRIKVINNSDLTVLMDTYWNGSADFRDIQQNEQPKNLKFALSWYGKRIFVFIWKIIERIHKVESLARFVLIDLLQSCHVYAYALNVHTNDISISYAHTTAKPNNTLTTSNFVDFALAALHTAPLRRMIWLRQ